MRPDPDRVADWVARRRAGESTRVIAHEFGVSWSWVSKVTVSAGPFPRPGTPTEADVKRWVQARRSGVSIAAIVRDEGVSRQRVATATEEFGPFRQRPGSRSEVGVTELAEILGLSLPTVLRWVEAGRVPPPLHPGTRGRRRRWARGAILQWVAGLDLAVCPQCGARPRDLAKHVSAVHRQR